MRINGLCIDTAKAGPTVCIFRLQWCRTHLWATIDKQRWDGSDQEPADVVWTAFRVAWNQTSLWSWKSLEEYIQPEGWAGRKRQTTACQTEDEKQAWWGNITLSVQTVEVAGTRWLHQACPELRLTWKLGCLIHPSLRAGPMLQAAATRGRNVSNKWGFFFISGTFVLGNEVCPFWSPVLWPSECV